MVILQTVLTSQFACNAVCAVVPLLGPVSVLLVIVVEVQQVVDDEALGGSDGLRVIHAIGFGA